ncbi:hypothetical protein LC040_12450 [Bacillus tianshenii]|nr:hypothetical protein LC040_12450 [Bacillus tianshenii]
MIFLPIALVSALIFYFVLQQRPFQYSKFHALLFSGASLLIVIITKLFFALYPWFVAMPVALVLLVIAAFYLQQQIIRAEEFEEQTEESIVEPEADKPVSTPQPAPKSIKMEQEEIDRMLGFKTEPLPAEDVSVEPEEEHVEELAPTDQLAATSLEESGVEELHDFEPFEPEEEPQEEPSFIAEVDEALITDIEIGQKEEESPVRDEPEVEIELEELGWNIGQEEGEEPQSQPESPALEIELFDIGEEPEQERTESEPVEEIEVEDDFFEKRLQVEEEKPTEQNRTNEDKRRSTLAELENDLF